MRISWTIVTCSCVLLSGCAGAPVATNNATSSVPGAALKGKVHGGQQPIVGASVYLYAANITGYGNESISLLSSAGNTSKDSNGNYYVTTDSNGNFTITGDYTCPSPAPPNPASQVYLYSVGGNPGLAAGTDNTAAGLLAALGSCPAGSTLSSSLYVVVNEVSTVAAAYAMAGFATDARHVSSSGTTLAQTGIMNAFANAANLETLNTGMALATTPAANGGNGTVPQSEINTLANILAACVNSTGPTSTPCTTLFTNAANPSEVTTETASAAINIAHNPGANIANLFALQTASSAFPTDLSTAPNDFTIAVSYSDTSLNGPYAIAIDATGNAWVANYNGSSVTEFSALGAVLSTGLGYGGGGLYLPNGIAIDASGNVWLADSDNGVTELNSSGTAYGGEPYTGGTLKLPYSIALDGSGDAWVANYNGSSVTELLSSGAATSGSPYKVGGLDFPYAIAVDGSGNAWVANSSKTVTKLSSSGTALSGSPITVGGLDALVGMMAIDGSGNVWVTNQTNNSVTKITNAGAAASGSPYSGGAMNTPQGIAIDGAGNAWVANNGGNSVTELSSSGAILSGTNGYTGGNLNGPIGLAVDGSGNVWVGNYTGETVQEFIGVAAPVITPIVAGLPSTPTANGTSNLGTRP